jgi:two-component system NtrC family sensor kinase
MDSKIAPPRYPVRLPLLAKLALITGIPFALFAAASLLFFSEWSRSRFVADTRRIGEEGEEEMRANTEEVLAKSHDIVTGLVEKTTEANRDALADLPFELWGVNEQAEKEIKEEIRFSGDALKLRSLETASAINRAFRRRAEARLESRVEAMRARQENASALFARRIQGQTVIFLGASILLLGTALALGLWFTVLKPVRRLHEGTEKAGAGDLDWRIETLSSDELGNLARSFNRMSGELAGSLADLAAKQRALEDANDEIREWNRTLEARVRDKTGELEASLEALKRTQDELVHAAKMAGIGTLAGGIAHEFNNMLGGISGCAQDALEEKDENAVRDALEVILRTSERACSVVQNLLRFSRKTPFQPARVDLAETLEDASRLMETELSRAGIRLETRAPGETLVEADPSQMQQVFLNLLTNAAHALEEADEKRIRVTLRAEEDEIVAEVEDAGPGIPEGDRDRVFEPFFTTKHGSGPSARVGTGLGLSVTYGIVESHRGSIRAGKSELGGARFTVRLPAAGKDAHG